MNLTRQGVVLSSRPWVIARHGAFDLVPGKPFTVPVFIQNSGHTPAMFLYGESAIALRPKADDFPDATLRYDNPDHTAGSMVAVGPDSFSNLDAPSEAFNAPTIDLITKGDTRLYVYGYVFYWDDFGKHGLLHCNWWDPQDRRFSMCRTYNLIW